MPKSTYNTSEPIAFFLTWTTYGTWLPGDERGWHRRKESEPRPPNELFAEMAHASLKERPFTLSERDRKTVESTIDRHCEIRQWKLHCTNARSNHVHVVVTASGYAPKTVRDQFKAWCTRYLKKMYPDRSRFWTEGGSCRSINQDDELESAISYVRDAQDRKGVD